MKSAVLDFETFCHNHDILINRVDSLSTKIRGFCYYDGQYYNVVLNNRFDSYQLRKTTIHEIIHVLQNHFSYDLEDAWAVEREVDAMIKVMELVFV